MRISLPRRRAGALAAVVGVLAFGGTASADSVSLLRPDADVTSQWFISGSVGTAWEALDENVTQANGTIPEESFIYHSVLGKVTEVSLSNVALNGATPLSGYAWYYMDVAPGQTVRADVIWGGAVRASNTVGGVSASPHQWHSIPVVPPDQAAVNDLRMRFTVTTQGSSTADVFATYFELNTGPPSAPTITEPAEDGQLVHPEDVHMEAMGFSEPEGHTHNCTDWEIRRTAPPEVVWEAPCATGLDKTHIHLGDGDFVNSYAGRTGLEFDSDYTLRVRFRDSAGEFSNWSERSFGTYPASSPGGAVTWTPVQPGFVVEEVAGGLQLPVNVAFVPNPGSAPNDPLLYVSELYGKIKVVTRDGSVGVYASNLLNFNPTGDFPGSGEQGLTGVVVDPASGDLFVSLLYDAAPPSGPHYPRVMRLHSTDGGRTAASGAIVLDMPGETQGQSHQISNLTIGPDGKLYVHMGDGFEPSTAQNLNSFRGKILRLNLGGTAPADNPFYNAANGITATDYVFARGFRNPFGGAWRAANNAHYEVENGPSVDRLAKVDRGANYLYDGSDASMANGALYNWDPAHAPVNIAFVQPQTFGGSGFPSSQMDHAFVTESGPTWATGPQVLGKRIVEFVPDPGTGELGGHKHGLVEYTGTGKATAAGLAAGPDGLYFTDLYRDQGYSSPIDPGARLLRVRYVPPGADPAARDTAAPETSITRRPSKRARRRWPSFHLASSEPGSRFQCRLDERPFKPCVSPFRPTRRLGLGKHTFSARAIDAHGNPDASPATRKFKVIP